MSRKNIIRCPFCNREYLPAEILYPKVFIGQPRDIIRDDKGEILGFNGEDMNVYETYICDGCNKQFAVEATVTFRAFPVFDIFAESENILND